MDAYQDLRLLLMALREGHVDPKQVAEVGLQWTPDTPTPFWDYLIEKGVVTRQTTTVCMTSPAPFTGGETPSFNGNGATPLFSASVNLEKETVAYPGTHSQPGIPQSRTNSGTRYETLRLHRTGGLGEVWLARDNTVGRTVALKTLRRDRLDDPENRVRFLREARITGQLEHPCIVPLYDLVDDHSDLGPCYVMRFIAGRTLAEAVADYHNRRAKGQANRLELAALLDAFVAVCRAVAFAHSRGTLHRDLKGQNVVIGDFGEVFLLDWGLAKSVGEADVPIPPRSTDSVGLDLPTRTGSVVGTPAYMAPEVAAGAPATKSSDIYGLGAVLYSILTARPPYDGIDPWTVVEQVIATEAPLPHEVNPTTPPALEAICRKAMARNPANRYASAEELANDVRRWLADEPVTIHRDSWTIRATRWARRHRTTVAAASVFLLTALVALAVTTALVLREERKTASQKQLAEQQANSLAGLTGRLIDVAEAKLAPVPESEPARIELLNAALNTYQRVQIVRPDDPSVRYQTGMLHRYRGNLFRLTDRLSEAERDHRQAVALLQSQDNMGLPEEVRTARLTEARVDHATVLARSGRLAEAANMLTAEFPDTLTSRMSAFVLVHLAEIEADRGRWTEAREAARKAEERYRQFATAPDEERHPYDPLFRALALQTIAATERVSGKPGEAMAGLTKTIDELTHLAKTAPPGLNPDDVRNVLSLCLLEQAQNQAASDRTAAGQSVTRAIEVWDDLAACHAQIRDYQAQAASARVIRGRIRLEDGRPTEARTDLTAARDKLERLADDVPQRLSYAESAADAHVALGKLARSEKTPGEANREYDKAISILRPLVARCPDSATARRLLVDAEKSLKE